MKIMVPLSPSLLEAVETLVQLASSDVIEAFWNLHVDGFLQGRNEISSLHVKLPHAPTEAGAQSEEQSNGGESHGRCKCFVIIDTVDLGVSLCCEPCFVADRVAVLITLEFKYPLAADDLLAVGRFDALGPGRIVAMAGQFFFDGFEPMHAVWSGDRLREGGWVRV